MAEKPEAVRNLIEKAEADALMKTGEVAIVFGVDPKTVTRWSKIGKLIPVRTPGGHRRYRLSEVMKLVNAGKEESK